MIYNSVSFAVSFRFRTKFRCFAMSTVLRAYGVAVILEVERDLA